MHFSRAQFCKWKFDQKSSTKVHEVHAVLVMYAPPNSWILLENEKMTIVVTHALAKMPFMFLYLPSHLLVAAGNDRGGALLLHCLPFIGLESLIHAWGINRAVASFLTTFSLELLPHGE